MSSSAFTPTQTQITNNVPTNVPVVEAWQSYTPTLTSSGGGAITLNSTGKIDPIGKWRRVGDSVEISIGFFNGSGGAATGNAGTVLFSLPSGLTVDSSKIDSLISWINPAGYGSFASGGGYANGQIAFYQTSTQKILLIKGATASAYSVADLVSSAAMTLKITLPIAEWAGSGTTTLATRAVEEYASNSSATDADDTTSFVYGVSGSTGIIGTTSLSDMRKKRVRFNTPILSTDIITIEIFDGSNWRPMESFVHTDGNKFAIGQLRPGPSTNTSTDTQGVGFRIINSTDIDVYFGRWVTIATSYTASWSGAFSGLGAKWRVRKVSGGAQVGYPVSARNIIGDTSGTTVPTGMIGENYTALQSTNIAAGSSGSYKNVTSLQLTQGIWDVSYIGWVDGNGATGWVGTNSVCALSTTTASSAGTVNTTTLQYGTNGSVNNQVTSMRGNVIINISSTTTYYLNLSTTYTGGTPQLYGNIIARRIA
jgi:hypothetical protein